MRATTTLNTLLGLPGVTVASVGFDSDEVRVGGVAAPQEAADPPQTPREGHGARLRLHDALAGVPAEMVPRCSLDMAPPSNVESYGA
jgi:hypothetical protein